MTLALLMAPAAEAARHGHKVKRAFDFEDKARHYVVYEPAEIPAGKKLPLVLVLHGALTNAKYASFESHMSRKADRQKFIVVYPEGTGGIGRNLLTWNAGTCCGPAQWQARNDVGFVRQLITNLKTCYSIDPDRIYVAGSSNGAMLAFNIAAEMGDVVAAVASVNGCVQDAKLKLRQPISILAFNGSRDKVIRFHGGTGSMLGYKVTCPDAQKTMKELAHELGCNESPKEDTVGKAKRETYTGGAGGTEVVLYTVPISHFWPGGGKPFPIITWPGELNATDVMCDFFWAHPKHDGAIMPSTTMDEGNGNRVN